MLRKEQLDGKRRQALVASILIFACVAAQSLSAQTASTDSSLTSAATSVSNALGPQNPYLGSVPTGAPTGTHLQLSLSEALDRGLKHNLGLIESDVATRTTRAERLRSLNELLPNVNASISQTVKQVNLRALGFKFNLPGFPVIVGPFGIQDARGNVTQTPFDWSSVEKLRASTERLSAAQSSYKSSRDLDVGPRLSDGGAGVPLHTDQHRGIFLSAEGKNNAGSGLINLSSNIGASVGISFVTTMLARRAQFHQTALSAHATAYSSQFNNAVHGMSQSFAASTPLAAQHQAYGQPYGSILRQSTMITYLDNFWLLGISALVMIPFVFLMKRPPKGVSAAAH